MCAWGLLLGGMEALTPERTFKVALRMFSNEIPSIRTYWAGDGLQARNVCMETAYFYVDHGPSSDFVNSIRIATVSNPLELCGDGIIHL